MRVRRRKIEQLVQEVLAKYHVKEPPVPVDDLAHKLGLEIESRRFADEEFSGILIREGSSAIVGVNASHTPTRQRFSIAHEIGHYLLHEGNRIFIDRTYNVSLRNRESSLGTNVEEIEANTFAASLLVPEHFLMDDPDAEHIDMEDDHTIKRLARKYRVSPQAMTYRLLNRTR
jgi:Zn-dependent peptidase ImmA (M78 family)